MKPVYALGVLVAAAVLTAGCVHHHHPSDHGRAAPRVVVAKKHGPPPHAPAHGHRHKHAHHGVVLVFDSSVAAYVIEGRKDHFFHGDHFYRRVKGRWQMSVRLDGGWIEIRSAKLPKGLAKKYIRAEKRKKRKHPHPAKHGY